jgi:hypothetical protein
VDAPGDRTPLLASPPRARWVMEYACIARRSQSLLQQTAQQSIQHTTAREVSKPHATACAKLLLCVCVSEC